MGRGTGFEKRQTDHNGRADHPTVIPSAPPVGAWIQVIMAPTAVEVITRSALPAIGTVGQITLQDRPGLVLVRFETPFWDQSGNRWKRVDDPTDFDLSFITTGLTTEQIKPLTEKEAFAAATAIRTPMGRIRAFVELVPTLSAEARRSAFQIMLREGRGISDPVDRATALLTMLDIIVNREALELEALEAAQTEPSAILRADILRRIVSQAASENVRQRALNALLRAYP